MHPVTLLATHDLLASDSSGHGLPQCPMLDPIAGNLPPFGMARICVESGERCDWNGDGREDIRDLVLMVRCLNHEGPCPDSLVADHDCDGDHEFSLDDVLCCADSILFGRDCERCPDDSIRVERDVKVAFGPSLGPAERMDLPLRIEGAHLLGAARLALTYPQDRYEVTGVDYGGAAAAWLHLDQARDGRVVIGLIDPGGAASAPAGSAEITLHLALKPGQQAGGEIALARGDFTGPDGVKLAVSVQPLSRPLGGPPRLALSESRPNPFGSETRFTVTLDRPGQVEVGIYDLGGRSLVTLFRGALPAGPREFRWDGRGADGTRAGDGVYFYRAVAGDRAVARKLVLLRRP